MAATSAETCKDARREKVLLAMSRYVKRGTRVRVDNVLGNAARRRRKDAGQCGVMLEDGRAGPDAGWDVYDVRLDSGRETFVHGFNLVLLRKKHR